MLCVLLVLLSLSSVAPAQPADPLQVQGFYRFYAGVRLAEEADFLVLRNRARLDLLYTYDRGRIVLSNDLRQTFGPPSGSNADVLYHLREAYLDAYFSKVDVRLGLQRIVWGAADGTFITDVLSPLDLSEFLTQDFADIRLGTPALNASYFRGSLTLTGVWMALPLASLLPDAASPWNLIPDAVAGLPVVLNPVDRPSLTLGHSELAFRMAYDGVPLTTITLMVFSGYNRLPVFRKTLAAESGGMLRIDVTPILFRRYVAGGTFSTTATDPYVLRGEVAVQHRYFHDIRLDPGASIDPTRPPDPALVDAAARGFLLEKPYVQAMLGAERRFGLHLVRVQALGNWIPGHDDRLEADAFEPAVTALWIGRFRRQTLTPQVFAYVADGGGYWLNPSLAYAVSDGLNASVGAQVFGGPAGVTPSAFSFGLYEANDFAYVKVQYDF